ncbi:LppP/LprE family lipoprotein [Mycobacterium hubeiense]|uniref:LppP/LprE family lipoprotein n=1 Tax=Mycobacterium hubeiense TaxID=1867256 RepID=UPI000C7E99E8|nr:LppP/LprE family lipoprotein [Mycobacterium sp. QGD 101]
MRLTRLIPVLMSMGLLAAGCGWSPPSAPPPKADTCKPSDGPSPETVQQAIAGVDASWKQTANGHTADCRLHWVQIAADAPASNKPQQVLFFDRQTPLGPATPDPRPYISVITSGDDTVVVQYQWQQGSDPACCPTGIGTVRFQIGEDGKLKPIDPIPND